MPIPRCHKELLRGAESKEAAEVLLKITGIAQCFKNLEILTGILNGICMFLWEMRELYVSVNLS